MPALVVYALRKRSSRIQGGFGADRGSACVAREAKSPIPSRIGRSHAVRQRKGGLSTGIEREVDRSLVPASVPPQAARGIQQVSTKLRGEKDRRGSVESAAGYCRSRPVPCQHHTEHGPASKWVRSGWRTRVRPPTRDVRWPGLTNSAWQNSTQGLTGRPEVSSNVRRCRPPVRLEDRRSKMPLDTNQVAGGCQSAPDLIGTLILRRGKTRKNPKPKSRGAAWRLKPQAIRVPRN